MLHYYARSHLHVDPQFSGCMGSLGTMRTNGALPGICVYTSKLDVVVDLPVCAAHSVRTHCCDPTQQAKAQLDEKLTAVWQSYQQGLCIWNFPSCDGSQLLPPASVFDACSAERTAASCAGDEPAAGAAGAAAAGACPASAAAAAAAVGGPCGQEGASSFKGAGQGLWARLHSVYFRDTEKRVPRWDGWDGCGAPARLLCPSFAWAPGCQQTAAAAHRELLVYHVVLPCTSTTCCTC